MTALLLSVVAIFFIYRSYQQNKRNAKALLEKNIEIEEKNKEIIDSINYAKRIQFSLMPTEKFFSRVLNGSRTKGESEKKG
jgi:hypothetical protein